MAKNEPYFKVIAVLAARWPPLALQITTPYTLCSYMVRTYLGAASDGSTEAEERIGRLTGILVSTDESQMSG